MVTQLINGKAMTCDLGNLDLAVLGWKHSTIKLASESGLGGDRGSLHRTWQLTGHWHEGRREKEPENLNYLDDMGGTISKGKKHRKKARRLERVSVFSHVSQCICGLGHRWKCRLPCGKRGHSGRPLFLHRTGTEAREKVRWSGVRVQRASQHVGQDLRNPQRHHRERGVHKTQPRGNWLKMAAYDRPTRRGKVGTGDR